MKIKLLAILLLLLLIAACNGNAVVIAEKPMVVGIARPTAIPDSGSLPTQGVLTPVDQDGTAHVYPGPADSGVVVVTEADPAIVEADATLAAYPGYSGTAELVPAEQSLLTSIPTPSISAYPGTAISSGVIPSYGYQIVNKFPHDRGSHIQGLVVDYDPAMLLEGSGLRGGSSLRRVVLETGEVTQFRPLPEQYFGEGITVFKDRIIQLTWKSGVGFIYDHDSFDLLDEFHYRHEGWGITHDGQQLIVSDGTAAIHFWDPETLQETRQIIVTDEFGPVTWLNELEFVDGAILANVWQTDTILRIDPDSGQVTGRIDLSGLLAPEDRDGTEGVLNGIAYESETERLFVTGKRWPTLYEIELVPLAAAE